MNVDLQYPATVREVMRAAVHKGIKPIRPVRMTCPRVYAFPAIDADGQRVLASTGVAALANAPLGTWLDMMNACATPLGDHDTPLIRQVRSWEAHNGKRFNVSATLQY